MGGETEQTTTALAKKIAHCFDREGVPETSSTDEIVIALYHAHLPKLDDYDFVAHDPEASRVTYTGHPALEEAFTTIYEPHDQLVEQFDGLISGLSESFRSAKPENDRPVGWPHHWSQHHG
jgi:hypothetical protein